jgi:effector-binding domain-containing protein
MPLDQVRAVLRAPDVETRTKEIITHLTAMETRLAQLQMSVASLRALLERPAAQPDIEFRSIPATPALAVRGTVTVEEAWAWGADAFGELYRRLDEAGLEPAGPGGALFPGEFFELEKAELTAFVPVDVAIDLPVDVSADGPGPAGGRVEPLTVPAVEAAVMLHCGPAGDIDQTYGALGTAVAERAIGVEGPIREYFPVPFTHPDPAAHRTEVCWPVFQTV